MTVATFVQPNMTTQAGNTYKTAIDAAIAAGAPFAAAFASHQQATPDMTVRVDGGKIMDAASQVLTIVAGQSTAVIAAPAANPRRDIVYIDTATGLAGVATGAEAASPTDPAIPAGKVPLARISLATTTAAIDNSLLDDLRPGLTAGWLVPTGDGSQLTGIITGATAAEKANIMLNAFRIAVNGGLAGQGMVDGVADVFSDQTGVDTVASTNETYDAAGKLYTNPYQSAVITQATGVQIGDMTAGGGLAAAWDGITNQIGTACAESTPSAANPTGYVGKDWGAGVTKTVNRYTAISSNNGGFSTNTAASAITLSLYGSNAVPASGTDGTLLHTDSFTNIAATMTKDYSTGIATTTAYRYHWVYGTVTIGTAERVVFAEINFYEQTPPLNMILQSVAAAALAQPDNVFAVLWHETIDAVALNTDLKAYASRDGGTTWTAGTLTQAAALTGNQQILTASVVVSAQPAGTAMVWKINTLNNKSQRLHGVAQQWS